MIGFVGLGKLGLPVASVMARSTPVLGVDIDREARRQALGRNVETATLIEVAHRCGVVFVAVPTPHEDEFDGRAPIPWARRADFDYAALEGVLGELAEANREIIVAVISTVLPGTYARRLEPLLLGTRLRYVYNPAFAAMGDVAAEWSMPEFVLVGAEDRAAGARIAGLYDQGFGVQAPVIETNVATAECIKVSYNTFVTAKTVLANTWAQIADAVGANIDDITRAWSLSTRRLLSPAYLSGGMGDGGPCHPRDNIALSWLTDQLDGVPDIFTDLMRAREAHAAWIARVACEGVESVCVLGRAYKPEVNLEDGSAAFLVAHFVQERVRTWAHARKVPPERFDCYVIATAHPDYASVAFAPGSRVVDPFGIIPNQQGVEVVRLGRRNPQEDPS